MPPIPGTIAHLSEVPPRAGARTAWPTAGVIVALVIAFAAGLAVSSRTAPAVLDQPAPTSAQDALAPLPSAGSGVLTLLGHPPLSIDRPGIPVGGQLIETSFRLVQSADLAHLYVARTIHGQVCLVAITADAQFASTCASPGEVQKVPLLLRFIVNGGSRVALLARLDPDGQAELIRTRGR
jgi:hypothetical protein